MIDIKLTGRLVMVLFCVLVIVGLLAYLTLTGERAVASEAETVQAASTGMRQFYLTIATTNGAGALTACAEGYHFASLWEIADPSNLKYNTSLGLMRSDSGQGPPAAMVYTYGWVRTGYISNNDSGTAGRANCLNWTSLSGQGTKAALSSNWTAGLQDMGVWDVSVDDCSDSDFVSVWCIED